MQVARREAHERAAWSVAGALAGAGRALLVVGEPGAGKSTLLAQALARAEGAAVLRTTGVPVEQGLAHAALHALLRPLEDHLPALPQVQRAALEVVLGLAAGPPPSPFLVGAATLGLLAAQAEQRAVVVAVDDAQWVDEASLQALAFAGRRLGAERVGLLLAARTAQVPAALDGVERIALGPLTAAEVAQVVPGLAPPVAAALVEATGGNVLALVERARDLDEAQRCGRAPLPPARVALFAVDALPVEVREAAALAALAQDVPAGVLRAARAAVGAADLSPAEDAGLLVAVPEGVRWRHPLAREAVLEALPPRRRRTLSAVLAEAARAQGAPPAVVVELRLAAVDGPDEELAQDLEQVARAAAGSGDHERAARLWARAAEVGTDGARHGARLFEAAEALLAAGHLGRARTQYEQARAAGLDDDAQARTHLALGRIEHTAGSPLRALRELQAAAACAATAGIRVRACAEGVLASMYAGAPDVAAALAARADEAHDPADPAERLLVLHARGAAAALGGDLPTARPLLAAAVAGCGPALEQQPDLVLWVITAALFSGEGAQLGLEDAAPAVERLRLRGDLTWLPRVVRLWGVRHELAGRWLTAYATYEEAVELSRAAEQTTQLVEALRALALLEAFRGEREACLAHVGETEQLLARLEVPFLASSAWWPRGLLHLALDEPAAAAAALAPAATLPARLRFREEAVADLVEALVLDGRADEAARVAAGAPSTRAAGVLAADDAEAVHLLASAAEQTADPLTGARCRLLAGERLRRTGHRREAREHLRVAVEVFTRAGAAPWLRRAEEGLRASGETLVARDERPEELTGAELRVAALVAEGRPTREVAALLFLSPKTVEFHLGRIYRKLGVRGRAELARLLAQATS